MIFAAIAIAWLAYLVPHFAKRRGLETEVEIIEPVDRFSDSMQIIRRGTAPLLDQDLEVIKEFMVSTPQTRKAAIKDLRRLEALAASRRRRVLLVLMIIISVVLGLCAFHLLQWWTVAIPGGLVVAFAAVARMSVQKMRASLDARYLEITDGNTESTVLLSRKDAAMAKPVKVKQEVATPVAKKAGALWDSVPITVPTYVSKPLAPRTVRTIDLSGPDTLPGRTSVPVTADAPLKPAVEVTEDHNDNDGYAAASA